MRGSRLIGATFGVALALTAGGVAVGLSSHPVGPRSAGVVVAAGTDRFEYAHVAGRVSDVRIDAYVLAWSGDAAFSRTQVGRDGYASEGGRRSYDEVFAYLRICSDVCRSTDGRLRAGAGNDLRNGARVYAGNVDGHDIAIEVTPEGAPAIGRQGYEQIEPGYPRIRIETGMYTYRGGRITSVTFEGDRFETASIPHNHAELYRGAGGGIYAGAFSRARLGR